VGAFSGIGGVVFGAELRSSSYKEPVLPSVQVLEEDEGKEGGSTSDSELLGDATSRAEGFTNFFFGLGWAMLLLFQPSRVT
jgi:hypothetical protein